MTIVAVNGCTVSDVAGVGNIVAVGTVRAMGQPIAVLGSTVTPHSAGNNTHPAETVLGSTGSTLQVRVMGQPIAGVGETCSLGGVIGAGANSTVRVG